MINPNDVELLIFDLDGTIFSTTRPVYESVKRAFAKINLPLSISDKEMEQYFGTASSEFYKAITPPDRNIHWQDIRKSIQDEHEAAFRELAQVFPGVKETLTILRERGYRLALHSNSSVHYFNTTISALDIRYYFDYIECVQENELTKTELVKKIINKFDNIKSAVIGDRVHDIEAAGDSNALSIGVLYGYGGKEPEEADITISKFPELLDIFNRKLPVFEKILEQVNSMKQKDKAFIIGINGIDCSGKTTFAESLDEFFASRGFKTQMIHTDDFHNPTSYRYSGVNQAENYYKKSFNISTIINELLVPIYHKKEFSKRLTLLNLISDKYEMEKEYTIDNDTIIIFEGVFLFRKELAPYIDYKIYLHISPEESKLRAKKRDSEASMNKYDDKYLPAQKKYLDEFPPLTTADMIIDNSNLEYPKIIKIS